MPQLIPVNYASRNQDSAAYSAGGSNTNTTQLLFPIMTPCTSFRLMYSSYEMAGNTTGEGYSMLTYLLQSSVQYPADSGTPVQVTWQGSTSPIAVPGGTTMFSDPISASAFGLSAFPKFAAGNVGLVAVRSYVSWTGSGKIPVGPYTPSSFPGLASYSAGAGGLALGINHLLTPGAFGVTSTGTVLGPLALLGYAQDGVTRPIVAIVGDSIADGYQDVLSVGGFAVRALQGANIPYYQCAHSGESVANIYQGQAFFNRLAYECWNASVIIDDYGTNDLDSGSSNLAVSVVIAFKLLFWKMIARFGAQVIPTTLLPRVTYSGSIFPASGQTPDTNNAAYQTYNAWIRAPASAGAGNSATYDAAVYGVTIPAIADIASYIESTTANATPGGPSAPQTGGVWYCGAGNATAYSPDGVHPNTAGVALIQPAVPTTLISTLLPPSSGVPTGTSYPVGVKLADLVNGNGTANIPWQIPAAGIPGSTGTIQNGSTSFSLPFSASNPHSLDELCTLLDRMISDKRASIL
jgi:lysophospholipase L1-like esterase